jgi:A/G-specific adenine glycosylase
MNEHNNGALRKRLLGWYDRNKRILPWRSEPTPYRVWLSEVMLQQTQVATVLPYYDRFLRRFPDLRALAAASDEDILELWAGLGYYTRARNLLRAARTIVERHAGDFPREFEQILALPGVGRYTAGAIQSIAFNVPRPVVDGNIKRVIARLRGASGELPEEYFWREAEALVPEDRPSDFNQAMMELGALVCVPVKPRCGECPMSQYCWAFEQGLQDRIPPPRRRRKSEEIRLVVLLASRKGQVLLCPQAPGSFVPGAWGLPSLTIDPGSDPAPAASSLARQLFGPRTKVHDLGQVRHTITYRKIVAHVFETTGRGESQQHWRDADQAPSLLTSSLFRKALNLKKSA